MNALGLSQRLAVVAIFLDDTSARHTVKGLCDRMEISAGTMSNVLNELVDRGMLARAAVNDPPPRRRRRIEYWMPREVEAKIRTAHQLEEVM